MQTKIQQIKYVADVRAKRVEALTADSKGHELWTGLDVRKDDLIVEKDRFSAFIQGSSNLGEVLRARSLDTLLIKNNPVFTAYHAVRKRVLSKQ
jgi:isochorismate hydrolase